MDYVDELILRFPRLAGTKQESILRDLERSASKFSLLLNNEHEATLEKRSAFEFAEGEYSKLELAADAGVLLRTLREKDASGKDVTYVDNDHPRLSAARAAMERAKSTYKESRARYESMRKSGCGDAAVLRRCVGYLTTTAAARKVIYAENGVQHETHA